MKGSSNALRGNVNKRYGTEVYLLSQSSVLTSLMTGNGLYYTLRCAFA